jgi:hypothetical protein
VLRQILKRHKLWANLQDDVKFEREYSRIGKALIHEVEKRLLAACGSNPLLIEHYSHIRMEAKPVALDAIATPHSCQFLLSGSAPRWRGNSKELYFMDWRRTDFLRSKQTRTARAGLLSAADPTLALQRYKPRQY